MITRITGARTAPELPAVPFDASHGHSLDDLLACAAPDNEPDDLDQFWTRVRAETLATDPRPRIGVWAPAGSDGTRSEGTPSDGTTVAPVRVRGLDGAELTGWLVRSPGELRRALVVGHGYGGRDAPQLQLPPGCLSIQLVARGLPGSEYRDYGTVGRTHVLSGIAALRTYSHVGATADQWTAATVVAGLAPGVPLGYEGGSFGGGIGVLAAAYEDRFDAVQVTVPSFGNHPLRNSLPCTGSGAAVREYAEHHPEVIEVLRYVDAATQATRVRVPVMCVAALADPAVPPPGQFAVATSFAGPTWLHVQPGGHAEWDGSVADLAESQRLVAEFWADPVAAVRAPDRSAQPVER